MFTIDQSVIFVEYLDNVVQFLKISLNKHKPYQVSLDW